MKLLNKKLSPEELYSELEEKLDIENKRIGLNVVRQYKIGNYFADFYYPDFNLVLEVDGKKFHSQSIDHKDRERDKFMLSNGYRVLRCTGSMVFKNTSGIAQIIPLIYFSGIYFVNDDSDLKNIQVAALGREIELEYMRKLQSD